MNGTVCAMGHVSLCDFVEVAAPYDYTWLLAIACGAVIIVLLSIRAHNPKHVLPVVHNKVPSRHI